MIDDKAQEAIMEAYERTVLKKSVLDENFASGKDIKWIADYLKKMANHWQQSLAMAEKSFLRVGGEPGTNQIPVRFAGDFGYGSAVNTIVSSGLDDLTKIKKQLDKMAKTGKI